MNDKELQNQLRKEIPDHGQDFWSKMDASLENIEKEESRDTDSNVIRLTDMTNKPDNNQTIPKVPQQRILLVAAAAVLFAVGGFFAFRLAADSSETATPADLPYSDIDAYENPIETTDELLNASDLLAHLELIEVIDTVGQEEDSEGGITIEKVGFVFNILETFSGKASSERITVAWTAYEVDIESGKRQKIRINGLDLTEMAIGDEVVFALSLLPGDTTYQITSTAALSRVEQNQLKGFSTKDVFKELDIKELADLQSIENSVLDSSSNIATNEAKAYNDLAAELGASTIYSQDDTDVIRWTSQGTKKCVEDISWWNIDGILAINGTDFVSFYDEEANASVGYDCETGERTTFLENSKVDKGEGTSVYTNPISDIGLVVTTNAEGALTSIAHDGTELVGNDLAGTYSISGIESSDVVAYTVLNNGTASAWAQEVALVSLTTGEAVWAEPLAFEQAIARVAFLDTETLAVSLYGNDYDEGSATGPIESLAIVNVTNKSVEKTVPIPDATILFAK